MAYLSLYRKWRPQVFDDVVGQEHVVRTLKNALDSRRVAHAYLFAGPRGTGKTTLARLLAKGLNCEKGPTGSPCNTCANCLRIARGACVDVIEIDGASNRGIDEIRDVRERVKFAPAEGEYKVYIIDEVHMLTTEAFNALLKVLEEPPRHVVFVFATTEPHKIPATIVSRCQKFDFRSFAPDEIVAQLGEVAQREGVAVDQAALDLIARHSDGGMRDALSYLDQCIAFGMGTVNESVVAQVLGVVEVQRLEELADALANRELGRCLMLVKSVADDGRDLKQFASDAIRYFRDLLVLLAAPQSEQLVPLPAEAKRRAQDMAGRFSIAKLLEIVETLGRAESDMRWASTPQLPLELALIELVKGERRTEEAHTGWDALLRRVETLERRLAMLSTPAGAPAASTAPPFAAGAPASAGAPPSGGTTASVGTPAPAGAPAPVASPSPAASVPSELQPTTQPPAAADMHSASPVSSRPESPGAGLALDQAATPVETYMPSSAAKVRAGETPETGRASKPAADAGSPPSAGEAELLSAIRAQWPRLLEQLRAERHVQQEAFLREGSPVAVRGDTLIVAFSPNHRFHQANMEKEKNRAIVEKVLSKVVGQPLRMRSVLGTEGFETLAAAIDLGEPRGAGRETGPDAPASRETPPVPATGWGGRGVLAAPGEATGTAQNAGIGGPADPAGSVSRINTPGTTSGGGSAAVPAASPGTSPETGAGETINPDEIDEPIVRAALKLFGGTITRIERTEAEEA